MSDPGATYAAFAAERGLEPVASFGAGPLTPLLVEAGDGTLAPAARGRLAGELDGVVGHLSYTRNKTFRFNVVLTEVAASTAFAPRLFCIRSGRSTRDDELYGFEARDSKLWTESTALPRRPARQRRGGRPRRGRPRRPLRGDRPRRRADPAGVRGVGRCS